jgi:hypothetical protein
MEKRGGDVKRVTVTFSTVTRNGAGRNRYSLSPCASFCIVNPQYASIPPRRGSIAVLSEAQANRRGLLRLMLRIPELRDQLREVVARDDDALSLCGAFEDASATLEQMRMDETRRHADILVEYEDICRQIEDEIRMICLRRTAP